MTQIGNLLVYDQKEIHRILKKRIETQDRNSGFFLDIYRKILKNNGHSLSDLTNYAVDNIFVFFDDPNNPSCERIKNVNTIEIDTLTGKASITFNGSSNVKHPFLTQTANGTFRDMSPVQDISDIVIDHIIPMSYMLLCMPTVKKIKDIWDKDPYFANNKGPITQKICNDFYNKYKKILDRLAQDLYNELYCHFHSCNLQLMGKGENGEKSNHTIILPFIPNSTIYTV
jgi:hypothetical protein